MQTVETLFREAAALHAEGRLDEAEGATRQALALLPDSAEAHFNLANILRDLGRPDEAVEEFIVAIRFADHRGRPYPDALLNLGDVLTKQGRFELAVEAFRQIIDVQPGRLDAHIGLGVALYDQGDFAGAVAAYEAGVRANPDQAPILNNIALALYRLGKVDAALDAFDRAIALDPSYPEGHTHRGLMLMLLGRYREGFAEYEWRWRTSFFRDLRLRSGRPEWRGAELDDLKGRTIVVYGEQGYGDTFQFARYLPILHAMGARVIALVSATLRDLIATVPGVESVLVPIVDPQLPPHDFVVPILSLPHFCGTTFETVPAPIPYIAADPHRTRLWAARMPERHRLRVGVVWAGRPEHPFDADRSMPLAALEPLADLAGVTFVALQQGPSADDDGLELWRPGKLADFGETAGIIANLDLVLTVDTSVAHLAGAMGAPTWVLLPTLTEWRWGVEGATTPWYPNMRLFRQDAPGDWAGVARQVRSALAEMLAGE